MDVKTSFSTKSTKIIIKNLSITRSPFISIDVHLKMTFSSFHIFNANGIFS
jgi:hypothetical protein